MSALMVALMVVVILLVGLGAVVIAAKALKKEVDKVHASRRASTPAAKD